MTLLDRYIARQFLANIALLFVLLFSIIIVIDFSLNFDEFTDIARRVAASRGWPESTVREGLLACVLVIDLWWPRMFLLFQYLLGIVLVGAMGFSCAQMVRHRELVAILAGGISLHRVARPVIGVALFMTGLQIINAEIVLPRLAPLLTRDKTDAGSRGLGQTRQPLAADASGRLFYARQVDLDHGEITGLWVWERDPRGLMTRRITAHAARWDGKGWVLEGGSIEARLDTPQGPSMVTIPASRLETDLDPTALRLRRFEGYSNNLSTLQLTHLLDRLRTQPRPPAQRVEQLERIRAGRPATMLANLLTLVIVLPFFLRREPANMMVQSLRAAPVAMAAVAVNLVATTASVPGLPPWLSVFLPACVLLPLAIASFSGIRT
ncbi:MAG: hypothetical protein HBSAPP03_12600 [Phycisphaerae bacterium]|nr:MAG: hypothetical protein HBSAPP03_12600 [Phycisphaerae bacterium]